MEKMLNVSEVMQILNVKKSTAYKKINEVQKYQKKKNRNINFLNGRVSESALREYYGL